MRLGDYECKTTFLMDFEIAENFGGAPAIKDTFRRAFAEWRENVVYLTELVMVLNWKMWQYDELGNARMTRLYYDLFMKAYDWGCENLKNADDRQYFFRTLD